MGFWMEDSFQKMLLLTANVVVKGGGGGFGCQYHGFAYFQVYQRNSVDFFGVLYNLFCPNIVFLSLLLSFYCDDSPNYYFYLIYWRRLRFCNDDTARLGLLCTL
mmetsp:Transcript_27486/g.36033  ORF Transcript_27486/g.36033 Transcript_27486/m.36033 type:complete len:104 (-) Transcript_27486:118-429(-)